MKINMPEGTAMAIKHLLQVSNEEGVSVVGFAFGMESGITNFGNTLDCDSPKLYELLCATAAAKRKQGLVIREDVPKPV